MSQPFFFAASVGAMGAYCGVEFVTTMTIAMTGAIVIKVIRSIWIDGKANARCG